MNVTKYNAKDCTVAVDNVFITQLGEDMVSGEKESCYDVVSRQLVEELLKRVEAREAETC